MTSYKVWNYDNAVLRHIVAKIFSLEVPIAKKRRSWKETPLSATERLWSNLTGIQTFHSRLTSSQHIPTVREAPDSLLASWFQSCIVQSRSPAYCLDCSAFLVAIIPMYYVTFAKQPGWTANIRGGNKNGKWSGNETTTQLPHVLSKTSPFCCIPAHDVISALRLKSIFCVRQNGLEILVFSCVHISDQVLEVGTRLLSSCYNSEKKSRQDFRK